MNDIQPTNVLQDISQITTIPLASLNRLSEKIGWCICNCVEESRLKGQDTTEVTFGFGALVISVENNEINYKFVPSKKFEKGLVETIVNKKNPLTVKLEDTFVNRIIKTYKDMM